MELSKELREQIAAHAKSCYPEECCGVVVNEKYIPCENVAADKLNAFKIKQVDKDRAEDLGYIQAYVHSHPDASARPSDHDLLQIELHQKPWIICSYPDCFFTVTEPSGYKPPLVGRSFHHGWQDCYTLIRDFYFRELEIAIPDFHRDDLWWEKDESLYIDNFQAAGFVKVDDLQYGDVILMSIMSKQVNHGAIYLGDNPTFKSEESKPFIGNPAMLHHMYDQRSSREIYSNYWVHRTALIVRHKDNLK